MTVTLYYKHKSNKGTLLAQGRLCPGWSDDEFCRLHAIIATITANPTTIDSSIMTSLATAPMPFLGTLATIPCGKPSGFVGTPKRPRRSLRRQSNRFRPLAVTSPVVRARLDNLESEVENLPALLADTRKTLISAGKDAEQRIKNDLKLHVRHKVDDLADTTQSLTSRVAAIEEADLCKLVRSLQQKVASLENENRQRKAEISELKLKLSVANK